LQVEILGDTAIAMGNYYFSDASDGKQVKVEYTFGCGGSTARTMPEGVFTGA
jgi:hypothetical protein